MDGAGAGVATGFVLVLDAAADEFTPRPQPARAKGATNKMQSRNRFKSFMKYVDGVQRTGILPLTRILLNNERSHEFG